MHPVLKIVFAILFSLFHVHLVTPRPGSVPAREGKFITVDIEKGMHDGQVDRLCTSLFCAIAYWEIYHGV